MNEVILNNGIRMPILGLGVYKTLDIEEMKSAVAWALESGYRSFDTAQMYKNEELLGEALHGAGIDRKEIFITSKVDWENMSYKGTKESLEKSLEKLQTEYLDLFLVHWPGQQKDRLLDTWRGMEELYEEKKIRALGVSNCQPRHLEWILENCRIKPVINQVERHPLLNEKGLKDWCTARNIAMEAWAPLMRGKIDLPEITALADKYGKTPAQIILRWDIQSGYVVIPKSVHQNRIIENAGIFDFILEEEDMELLDGMNQGKRTSFDPETFDF
ncbi:aldo/keto reductase [Lachnospiraceae bacterium 62-35]